MRNSILLVPLLGLCACAGKQDTTIDIVFDACSPLVLVPGEGAGTAEVASIERAMSMWNDLAATKLTLSGADESAPRLPIKFERAAGNFFGVYEDEVGEVYINSRLSDDRERAITVAHEVGHAFGLPHIDDRVSVMEKANLEIEPNAADASALWALWGDCRVAEPQ